MAKDKKSSPDSQYDWKDTLDTMQRDHVRRGQPPLKPVTLPSGEIYQPKVGTDTPVNVDQDTLPATPGMNKGGKIKKSKPRGVGVALRGHTRAK